MGFYIGKRLGKGWGVGTRVRGGVLNRFFSGIFMLVLISLSITYWKVFVPILVLLVLLYFFKQENEAERQKKEQALRLTHKLKKYTDKIENLKTHPAKLNNVLHALDLIREIAVLDPKQKVLRNRLETTQKLTAMERIIPIDVALEKAEKAEFKGKKEQALDAVLDALYICDNEDISDADFELVGFTHKSGTAITVEFLRKKAESLGWKR